MQWRECFKAPSELSNSSAFCNDTDFLHISVRLSIFKKTGHFKLKILTSTAKVRSSRPEVFCKKGTLRNSPKFTAKNLCQRLPFNKVATLSKKSLWHWCFPVNIGRFLEIDLWVHFMWRSSLQICRNLLRTSKIYSWIVSWGCSKKVSFRLLSFFKFLLWRGECKRSVKHTNFAAEAVVRRCSVKNVFAKFTRKHLCRSPPAATLLK